ncbi:crossover junction endodeoxyribonuclease RuvC [Treponema sp. HNW]|uniref:crossover junction endodeoxyribonuclease RuvC n=1 Tax=Treponema sp. HNW TaxID=3116654 RepID=UPI003D10C640
MPGTKKFVSGTASSSKMPPLRRVLGLDPGLASTGWAVVDYEDSRYRCAAQGVIETEKDLSRGERLLLIYNRLQEIIDAYEPSEAGMETLYFAKNVTSALCVAEARGVLTLCLCSNSIPLFEYSPNCIKKSVSGTAKADKALVQQYVKLLLGLSEIPKPDHAADALAAAITHIHSTC